MADGKSPSAQEDAKIMKVHDQWNQMDSKQGPGQDRLLLEGQKEKS